MTKFVFTGKLDLKSYKIGGSLANVKDKFMIKSIQNHIIKIHLEGKITN